MKTSKSESCSTHALYHSIKSIIAKIIYNYRISYYDVTKGITLDKLLNNSSLNLSKIRTLRPFFETKLKTKLIGCQKNSHVE